MKAIYVSDGVNRRGATFEVRNEWDWSEAWDESWNEADDGYDDWAELQVGETSDPAGNIFRVDEESNEALINVATGNVKREWRKLPRTFQLPFTPHGKGAGKGKGKEKGKQKGKSKGKGKGKKKGKAIEDKRDCEAKQDGRKQPTFEVATGFEVSGAFKKRGSAKEVLANFSASSDDEALDITVDAAAGSSVAEKRTVSRYLGYMQKKLYEYDAKMPRVNERPARQSFIFGDGRKVDGLYKLDSPIILPSGRLVAMATVVAKSTLPILMSRNTLVKMGAIVDVQSTSVEFKTLGEAMAGSLNARSRITIKRSYGQRH